MATFVLVHGGDHGGWCHQNLAKLLRAGENAQRAVEADHVFETDTGHGLMTTEPRAVADMPIEVVRREAA